MTLYFRTFIKNVHVKLNTMKTRKLSHSPTLVIRPQTKRTSQNAYLYFIQQLLALMKKQETWFRFPSGQLKPLNRVIYLSKVIYTFIYVRFDQTKEMTFYFRRFRMNSWKLVILQMPGCTSS